jgi:putative membrane protein
MSCLNDPRVLFAAERTLLAWNRTSLALIAFGFVVERASLLFQVLKLNTGEPAGIAFAFWLGIAFILIGSICSAYSARQYAVVLRSLSAVEFPPGYSARWGLAINYIVAALGACLALAIIFGRA